MHKINWTSRNKAAVAAIAAGITAIGLLAFGLSASARGNGPGPNHAPQTTRSPQSQIQVQLLSGAQSDNAQPSSASASTAGQQSNGARGHGPLPPPNGAMSNTITDTLPTDGPLPPPDSAMTGTISGTVPAGGLHGEGPGPGRGPVFGLGSSSPISIAAAQLGLDEATLRADLQAGQTLSDVAASQGVVLSDIADALLAALKSDLAQALSDGKLTQAQADQILADAPTRINDFLTGTLPQRPQPHDRHDPLHSPLATSTPRA